MNTVAVIPSKTQGLMLVIVGQVEPQVDSIFVMDNTGFDLEVPVGVVQTPCRDMGIHEMWNLGIEDAQRGFGSDVRVLFLNDDVTIKPNFVEELHKALDDPNYESLMAVCGNYDGRGGPPVTITSQICAGRYDGTGGFAGFGFMLHEEWLQDWRFDENMEWWGGDNDLLLSLHQRDFQAGIVRDAHMYHRFGGSQTIGTPDKMTDEMKVQCALDLKYLTEKWS